MAVVRERVIAMVVACRMVLKMKVVVERLMVMVVDDGLVAQMMAKGWKRDSSNLSRLFENKNLQMMSVVEMRMVKEISICASVLVVREVVEGSIRSMVFEGMVVAFVAVGSTKPPSLPQQRSSTDRSDHPPAPKTLTDLLLQASRPHFQSLGHPRWHQIRGHRRMRSPTAEKACYRGN